MPHNEHALGIVLAPADRELDLFVEAFEEACQADTAVNLAEYLPDRTHDRFLDIATELVRIDLELRWQDNRSCKLGDYETICPEIFRNRDCLERIAFEEYRLRRHAGDAVQRDEYENTLEVDTSKWPELPTGEREEMPGPVAVAEGEFPEIGEKFCGFELVGELGRGAFGRVYLARQKALADRYVALKVTTRCSVESQRLASMQHTNIVPVYSVHQNGALQAICMPFFGSITLADLLRTVHASGELPQSGRALLDTVSVSQTPTETASQVSDLTAPIITPDGPAVTERTPQEDLLSHMTYQDAMLWLVQGLSEGLAHAHDRGIIHRDLKPANVLLTSDGQPMLLDFNVAAEVSEDVHSQSIGGTIPYMAPEHLTALLGGGKVDRRSDVYSLGVILFEMLTGTVPYPPQSGSRDDEWIKNELTQRSRAIDGSSLTNASASVNEIVKKCLAARVESRYQSAAELAEDLRLHLDNRPLRHARNRSLVELARKWFRRHPRIVSASTVAIVAMVLLCGVAALWVARSHHVARLEAKQLFESFQDEFRQTKMALNTPDLRSDLLAEVEQKSQAQLEAFSVGESPDWRNQAPFRDLPERQKGQLEQAASEMLYLLAASRTRPAILPAEKAERQEQMTLALRNNALAAGLLPPDATPRALLLQRAKLLEMSGNESASDELQARAMHVPVSTRFGLWLLAEEDRFQGRYEAASGRIEELLESNSSDASAWYMLGICHAGQRQHRRAEQCFTVSAALWSQPSHWPYFHRGLSRLELKDYAGAVSDFERVLKLRPQSVSALINRAIALNGLGEFDKAVGDLDLALVQGATATRLYFLRARILKKTGRTADAEKDIRKGLSLTPRDEKSWISRGIAKLADDPDGALDDFRMALKLNPRSHSALQNIVYVLSERLDRTEESIEFLNQLVKLYPSDAVTRATRGVIQARLGRLEVAIRDAEAAVRIDDGAETVYRAACVYAISSKDDSENQKKALSLLARALQKEGRLAKLVRRDPDLTNLAKNRELQILAAAANTLQARSQADE